MEVMSIFSPHIIGPALLIILKNIKENGFKNFMCACSTLFKDEPSWRCHLNMIHRETMNFIANFSESYDRLPLLDFSLLGETSGRNQFSE